MSSLRIILGDQLSTSISSLQGCDKTEDIILMCEVWEEATAVKHHKKKIVLIFAAMRHFARQLQDDGYRVHYIQLDNADNSGSFGGEVARALKHYQCTQVIATEPGEYRVLQSMQQWQSDTATPVEIRSDHRFMCSRQNFSQWAHGRKQMRMEHFYHQMRKDHNILMDGDKPIGGQWNYDSDNRKPPTQNLVIPAPFKCANDEITQQVTALVEKHFGDHFGDIAPFHFAVTREQALQVLAHFIDQRLGNFGDYQDAMVEGEPWMYHAHISFYLNIGLLLPAECIKAASDAYQQNNAPLNAVEGFIRQILGWREYIRGIYWLKMPDYAEQNFLQARRPLPDFYWTGDTDMNCLHQCIKETKHNAYAHHIQRLMVLGNFALLAGIDPDKVNEWFLIVYADAFEWVEKPNVSGMVLFADGGVLASKPYAAGGNYINKMSNYCQNCHYSVSKKTGDKACPFNYLYWDFIARNRDKLSNNYRIAMMYRTYDRMSQEKQHIIARDSQRFLDQL